MCVCVWQNGNTALSIARRLGYISVVDTLRGVTDENLTATVTYSTCATICILTYFHQHPLPSVSTITIEINTRQLVFYAICILNQIHTNQPHHANHVWAKNIILTLFHNFISKLYALLFFLNYTSNWIFNILCFNRYWIFSHSCWFFSIKISFAII